jgi:hypothetical protein
LFLGEVHIGAKALLDRNFIWFGYIARLSQLDYYLLSLRLEGVGVEHDPVEFRYFVSGIVSECLKKIMSIYLKVLTDHSN